MDRLKTPLRIANTLALFLFVYAMLVDPSSAAPSTGPLAAPMSPGFEYEGRLGNLSGKYDFKFRLFGVPTGGSPVYATTAAATAVPVYNGEYRTVLRFGDGITSVLAGEALYVEVFYRVATTNANAPYTLQTGTRAQLMPQAYAMSLRPGATTKGNLTTPIFSARNNGTGTGIYGHSPKGAGVMGESTSWVGMYGLSSTSAGVWGKSTSGTGMVGESTNGIGVWGESTQNEGVRGTGHNQYHAGVVGYNTAGGFGVFGQSTNGAGVVGESTNWLGVYGQSSKQTGVAGKSTTGSGTSGESRDLYGVFGTSTNGEGVRGESFATGKGGVVGINNGGGAGYGVYGQSNNVGLWGVGTNNAGVYATSTNGTGVQAVVGNPNALGVWAVNNAGGYALAASGNASQSLSGGGFVKAMALVDPYDGADNIKQCFNSQLPGTQSTSGNCGIVANMGPNCTGWREINFGFKVDDRFVSVTPLENNSAPVTAELRSRNATTWDVTTSYTESGQSTCAKFFIIVY